MADIKLMRKVGHQAGEAGSALLASVLLITLITGVGLATMTTTGASQNKARNLMNEKQAFYLADAGLAHSLKVLNQNIANWNTYATPQTLIASTALAGIGSYTVTIKAASGPGLLLTATGSAPNNASKSMSSLVTRGYSNYGNAFITGQDLTISGSPTIDGTAGGVYANRNLTISGNPHITTNAEAVGTYTATGLPVVSGFAGGSQPTISVNNVDGMTYYTSGAVDYYLKADGSVYDKNWVLQSAAGTNLWNCWTPAPSANTWTLTCSTPPNGTYWVGMVAILQSDAGTAATPWIATILSVDSIEVRSTTLYMRPPAPTDAQGLYKPLTRNLLFVTSLDLKIVGTATQTFSGIARAYEQVSVSGAPTLNGYIIAQDSASASPRVTANVISGNMHLTYNGNLANGLQDTAQVQSTLY